MSKIKYLKIFVNNRLCSSNISSSAYRLSIDPLESRFVAKIFKKQKRKKKNDEHTIFDAPVTIPEGVLGKTKRQPQAKPIMSSDNPRLHQTERILHENISNIIQTGQIGLSVPITKVRLLPDFSQLNIYWEATGDAKRDKKIQNTLNSRTKPLRYLLSTAQESRYVPTISFLKDLSYARERELEAYFKDLDTGTSQDMKETQDSGKTCQNAEGAIKSTEKEQSDNGDTEHDIKWVYNQNVFGVPHDLLMKKVLNSRLKTKVDDKADYLNFPDEKNSFSKIQKVVLGKKKIHAKRREDVKQISRLLGVHSKSDYLKGDLTHLIPDVLEEDQRQKELVEKLEEYKRQGPAFFDSEKYKNSETTSLRDSKTDQIDLVDDED